MTYTALRPEAPGEFSAQPAHLLGFPESGTLFSPALAAAALSLLMLALIAWACWAALRAPGDAAAFAGDKSPADPTSLAGDPSLSEIGDRVLALFFLGAAVMHIGLLLAHRRACRATCTISCPCRCTRCRWRPWR